MHARSSANTVERIPAEGKLWFISDLHLGDGTPSDAFFGKDHHLMALLRAVERDGGTLIVVGDAMDFAQAWTFTRILRAHQEILGAMSRLSRQGRMYYIVGNHDYDLSLYREVLAFRVCHELHIGDEILVQHGYQYDPYIGEDVAGASVHTMVHHLLERYLDTWIRVPLKEFYTPANRVMFWLVHKLALAVRAWTAVLQRLGLEASAQGANDRLEYWSRANMGDSMCMFNPVWERLQSDRWKTIVCGHSHLPGVVRRGDRCYVNTGSWTFASSHYVTWEDGEITCRDWITGQEFAAELYQPILDGVLDRKDFWIWWRENYMGWLRFREGEEGLGHLRGWESYIRDHQHLAALRPVTHGTRVLPPPPPPVPQEES